MDITGTLPTMLDSKYNLLRYDPLAWLLHEGLSCSRAKEEFKLLVQNPQIQIRERSVMSGWGLLGALFASTLSLYCFAMHHIYPSIDAFICSILCALLGYSLFAIVAYFALQIKLNKKEIESMAHQA